MQVKRAILVLVAFIIGVIVWQGVKAQMAAELLVERAKVSWAKVP